MTDVPALTQIDHESDYGRWTLLRRMPPAPLLPYVVEMQGYCEEDGPPVTRKELPSGIVPMILVFGPGFAIEDPRAPGGRRPLDRSFVAGLHDSYAIVGSAGNALCMQIDFTPLGARRFLNIPMDLIAGQVVDLRDVLQSQADLLEEKLADAPDWASRFEIVEQLLVERLSRPVSSHAVVKAALEEILARQGDVRIGSLAQRFDHSRKHLVTLFRREVGLTPKTFARVIRFEGAMGRLQQGAYGSLAELAASCGYADQAHFNRDFLRFAGECPSHLLARILPDGTGVMAAAR
ncbi:MAG: helix-turn-helix domain-containing protein [Rhodomicrobiaceae bacterium]